MPPSPARKQRRATEASVKKSTQRANRNGVKIATKLELDSLTSSFNQGLQQLSNNQNVLGSNFNKNLEAIRSAFIFTDAHLHIHRRIMNDLALSRQQMVLDVAGLPESIDFSWYHAQYQHTKHVISFVTWLKKILGEVTAEEEAVLNEFPAELPADDFTFGGNYESKDSS